MRQLGLNLVIGLGVLALFLPFQNCSVYKSKDRDNYEQSGPPSVRGAQKPSPTPELMELGQPVVETCSEIVDQTSVRSWMGSETRFRLFTNSANQQTCQIIPPSTTVETDIHFNCRFPSDPPDSIQEFFEAPESEWDHRQGWHIGIASRQQTTFRLIEFYGLSEAKSKVIDCQVSFTDPVQFEQNQQKVRNLGRQLAEHLTQQI